MGRRLALRELLSSILDGNGTAASEGGRRWGCRQARRRAGAPSIHGGFLQRTREKKGEEVEAGDGGARGLLVAGISLPEAPGRGGLKAAGACRIGGRRDATHWVGLRFSF